MLASLADATRRRDSPHPPDWQDRDWFGANRLLGGAPEEDALGGEREVFVGFLAVNDDRAFKAREIGSQIWLDKGVSAPLSRLKDRRLVDH